MDTLQLMTVIEEVVDCFEKAGWNRAHAYEEITKAVRKIRPAKRRYDNDDDCE